MATVEPVRSLARRFSPADIANFVEKDASTVRKWFENMIGVRKYPRGDGNQRPSLAIPEPIVRQKLQDIGYSTEEIEAGLIEEYDRRILANSLKAEEPAPRKRGRPAKNTKLRKRGTPS